MIQQLYQAKGVTVVQDTTQGWLITTWQGQQTEPGAQHSCEQILQQVQSTRSRQILNDGSQDYDGWDGITPWLVQNFFPRLAASGITDIAWVIPQNLRARAAMNQVAAQVVCLNVTTFEDIESAYSWLCQRSRVGRR